MRFRAAGAVVFGLCVLAHEDASAAEGPEPHGAIVVALGDDTKSAAEPLARVLYRDPALRPGIDDATARVLAGEEPDANAPAALRELASVRRSIAASETDPTARRVLASLGADAHAAL